VDNLDIDPASHRVYGGAAKAARCTVAAVGPGGALSRLAVADTRLGARNPVVAADGSVFLTDAAEGALLVLPAPVR
jgi:hypothetical protein